MIGVIANAGCEADVHLLVMLVDSCSDWSSVSPPLSSSLRRAISASWHMTLITSSTFRNMEKSLCFRLVWTRITSVSKPTDTRSSPVTSAHGTNSFTERKNNTLDLHKQHKDARSGKWEHYIHFSPHPLCPVGRSRRRCGWWWGTASPGAARGPSSSSRSNASPVSLAEGGRSAARIAPDLPESVSDHLPEQPDCPKPPQRLNPTQIETFRVWIERNVCVRLQGGRTFTLPCTKLAASSLFSNTAMYGSRFWSSHFQCFCTSSIVAPANTHRQSVK